MRMEKVISEESSYDENIVFYLYSKIDLMKIKEIISILDELAPLSYSENFDNTGLLVGNIDNEILDVI